jgi:HEAT repeat protein
MIGDIEKLLGTLESGTREEIWEAAKDLESLVLDISLALLRRLRDSAKTDTRAAAAYVLGFGHFASARIPLEEVLDDANEDSFVRGHAAEALAYIGDRESAKVLLKHMEDTDPGVRYWCIFALGQIRDDKALPVLRRVVETGKDEHYDGHSLRAEARDAIAEIEGRGSR